MNLARRSITSMSWNFAANLAVVGLLAIRMLLLTRWLSPEIFGTYAFAYAVVVLTAIIPNFGMGQAFIHRSAETENEERAAAVHFTLRLLFTTIWAILLLAATFLLADNDLEIALLIIIPASFAIQITQTPSLILRRRVDHRRLALADFIEIIFSSLVALALAWRGAGIWALLATDIISASVKIFALYIYRPVWKPRLKWDKPLFRYYLQFGSRAFVADALSNALDRVDDLWTGIFLGQTALGIYSRAYAFATYPRKLLADPVNAVTGGMYAELKENHLHLSQAFFRTNAFLIRAGFLLAGALAVIAPELIQILGPQWQDMLIPFRLMLLFILLDPIKLTIGLLFMAVGQPNRLVQARTIQLVVLLVGLIVLGTAWGVNGVALAVDIMLIFGIAILLHRAREIVNYSVKKLFFIPLLAITVAFIAVLILEMSVQFQPFWLNGIIKLILFSVTYLAIWLAIEREDALRMYHTVRKVRQFQE